MNEESIDNDYDPEMKALDRLVTAEFNALRQKNGKAKRSRRAPEKRSDGAENVIFRDNWSNDESAQSTSGQTSEMAGNAELEAAKPELACRVEAVAEPGPQAGPVPDMALFTDEEREFIQHAAQWLGSRGNKDLIMSRIWESVTEAGADSFYSPRSDEPQTQTDGDPAQQPGLSGDGPD